MENYSDSYSALGTDPKCDECGKYIKPGDHVVQTFAGKVKNVHGELVVMEEAYHLVHLGCETYQLEVVKQ